MAFSGLRLNLRLAMPILCMALSALLAPAAACGLLEPTEAKAAPVSIDRSQVNGILAASEMLVGENRFPFALANSEGTLIEGARVHARFYRLLGEGRAELRTQADANFLEVTGFTPHQHADGQTHMHEEVRGLYVVQDVNLSEPGYWQARFDVRVPGDTEPRSASVAFEVKEASATLRVGDPIPPSRSPTARDVMDLAEITTHHPPVPGFYEHTVAEALELNRPLVVVFSTPAFCLSRMCGPVTDVAAQLYEEYESRVSFIHIEPWDLELARTEGRLALNDVSKEWRLPSEPWVFVVDAHGRVAARFEGLFSRDELARAINAVVPS